MYWSSWSTPGVVLLDAGVPTGELVVTVPLLEGGTGVFNADDCDV
jgi:hypothetical protein